MASITKKAIAAAERHLLCGSQPTRALSTLGSSSGLPPYRAALLARQTSARRGLMSTHGLAPVRLASTSPTPADGSAPVVEINEEFDSGTGVLSLTLNRPQKRNAITETMYQRITHVLKEAGQDSAVRVIVLTGSGPFYSAGNDLSNFTKGLGSGRTIQDLAADAAQLLQAYVDAWITCPKLLFVAVNGPAVGIPVTTLPLADAAWASTTATFHTPFIALGQAPEACSSITFPRLMGPGASTEMLLLGRQINAQEALERKLVAGVEAPEKLVAAVQRKAKAAAALPRGSMLASKALIRQGIGADELRRVNERECNLLKERWASKECQDAVMAFLMKKAN